jgi:hypothetical protein
LIFIASLLNTHYYGERAKTGWLGIRIMYPSVALYVYPRSFVVYLYIKNHIRSNLIFCKPAGSVSSDIINQSSNCLANLLITCVKLNEHKGQLLAVFT